MKKLKSIAHILLVTLLISVTAETKGEDTLAETMQREIFNQRQHPQKTSFAGDTEDYYGGYLTLCYIDNETVPIIAQDDPRVDENCEPTLTPEEQRAIEGFSYNF